MSTGIMLPVSLAVENYLTHAKYVLQSLDRSSLYEAYYPMIIQRCNEPKIYERLFKEKFNNEPYSFINACEYFVLAHNGWQNSTNFVFTLLSAQNEILGMFEIRTAFMDDDEIGYWLSEAAHGAAANSVLAICNWAKDIGFKKLHAYIALDNTDSMKVVTRAGFNRTADRLYPAKDETYAYFEKTL